MASSPPARPPRSPRPAKRRRRYVETADYLSMLRRMVTAAGRRVGRADADDLRELLAIRAELDEAIARAVAGLRRDGYTWAGIAEALGITRQAAQQRWGAS